MPFIRPSCRCQKMWCRSYDVEFVCLFVVLQEYERCARYILPACSRQAGRHIDQTFAILDMKGRSFIIVWAHKMAFVFVLSHHWSGAVLLCLHLLAVHCVLCCGKLTLTLCCAACRSWHPARDRRHQEDAGDSASGDQPSCNMGVAAVLLDPA